MRRGGQTHSPQRGRGGHMPRSRGHGGPGPDNNRSRVESHDPVAESDSVPSSRSTSSSHSSAQPQAKAREAKPNAPPQAPPAKPVPQHLAQTLAAMQARMQALQPTEVGLNDLTQLCQDLHTMQGKLEQATRDHSLQHPVPAFFEALGAFIQRLNKALHGSAENPRGSREANSHGLPLYALAMSDIHALCLGFSTLGSSKMSLPLAPKALGDLRRELKAINAQLMWRTEILGGAAALTLAHRLEINGWLCRGVKSRLLNLQDKSQSRAGKFCCDVFSQLVLLAGRGHGLETAHNISKCASQIEAMFDHDLGGVADPEHEADLAMVVAWLLNEDALNLLAGASDAVALSCAANLAKRLLEQGRLDADDGKLDTMWAQLLRTIARLDADGLIKPDGRTLSSFANLVRVILHSGLPQRWRRTMEEDRAREHAGGKLDEDARREAALQRQALADFLGCGNNIVAAMSAPSFLLVNELQSLTNLFTSIRSWDRQQADAAPLEGGPASDALAIAAASLLQRLPQAELGKLKLAVAVSELFVGLGHCWQRGLVQAHGKPVQCLVLLLQAMVGKTGWSAASINMASQVIERLLLENLLADDILQAAMTALRGPRSTAWTLADVRQQVQSLPSEETVKPLPVIMDKPALPTAAPASLVGETTLLAPRPRVESSAPGPSYVALPSVSESRRRKRAKPMAAPKESAWERAFKRAAQAEQEEQAQQDKEAQQAQQAQQSESAKSMGVARARPRASVTKSITTTTSSTVTTTTTTVTSPRTVAATQPEDPAAIRKKWLGLLLRPPSATAADELVAMARAHPECLTMLDENGHDTLWKLVFGNQLKSMQRLTKELAYCPSVSSQNMRAMEAFVLTLKNEIEQTSWLMSLRALVARKLPGGQTAFAKAVVAGDETTVARMLGQCIDFLMADQSRLAILQAAIFGGHAKVLDLLLAEPSYCAQLGQPCANGGSFLHLALRNASSASATPSANPCLVMASRLLKEENLRRKASASGPQQANALGLAIKLKQLPLLKEMLEYPEMRALLASLTIENVPALYWAIKHQDAPLLSILATHKAEARPLHHPPLPWPLPLDLALELGTQDMVKTLLEDKRAYRDLSSNTRSALVWRAVSLKRWELVPLLLAYPGFAEVAGKKSDLNGKTVLVQAVLDVRGGVLTQLLGASGERKPWQEAVCDSVFMICQVPMDMPFGPETGIAHIIAGVTLHREMDAVMLAVESGPASLLDPLLALPTVQQRLRRDQEWKAVLLQLARDEGHVALIARLQEM